MQGKESIVEQYFNSYGQREISDISLPAIEKELREFFHEKNAKTLVDLIFKIKSLYRDQGISGDRAVNQFFYEFIKQTLLPDDNLVLVSLLLKQLNALQQPKVNMAQIMGHENFDGETNTLEFHALKIANQAKQHGQPGFDRCYNFLRKAYRPKQQVRLFNGLDQREFKKFEIAFVNSPDIHTWGAFNYFLEKKYALSSVMEFAKARFFNQLIRSYFVNDDFQAVRLFLQYIIKDKEINSQKFFNVKNEEGETLVHDAALKGAEQSCQVLLFQYGRFVNINQPKSNGYTLLHIVLGKDLPLLCDFLINDCLKQIDVNCRSHSGRLPLHIAIGRNSGNYVKIIAENTDPKLLYHWESEYGDTPLHMAIRTNNIQNIYLLLLAHPNLDIDYPNREGLTPLALAEQLRNTRVATYLNSLNATLTPSWVRVPHSELSLLNKITTEWQGTTKMKPNPHAGQATQRDHILLPPQTDKADDAQSSLPPMEDISAILGPSDLDEVGGSQATQGNWVIEDEDEDEVYTPDGQVAQTATQTTAAEWDAEQWDQAWGDDWDAAGSDPDVADEPLSATSSKELDGTHRRMGAVASCYSERLAVDAEEEHEDVAVLNGPHTASSDGEFVVDPGVASFQELFVREQVDTVEEMPYQPHKTVIMTDQKTTGLRSKRERLGERAPAIDRQAADDTDTKSPLRKAEIQLRELQKGVESFFEDMDKKAFKLSKRMNCDEDGKTDNPGGIYRPVQIKKKTPKKKEVGSALLNGERRFGEVKEQKVGQLEGRERRAKGVEEAKRKAQLVKQYGRQDSTGKPHNSSSAPLRFVVTQPPLRAKSEVGQGILSGDRRFGAVASSTTGELPGRGTGMRISTAADLEEAKRQAQLKKKYDTNGPAAKPHSSHEAPLRIIARQHGDQASQGPSLGQRITGWLERRVEESQRGAAPASSAEQEGGFLRNLFGRSLQQQPPQEPKAQPGCKKPYDKTM